MTKRHDSLIPLTHDHHHALAQARRLLLGAEGSPEDRTIAAKGFVAFFETDTLTHFREEEETVFPLVVTQPSAEPILARAMIDHLRLHALVHDLKETLDTGAPSGRTLRRIADLLEKHIRFEEKEVFPMIERLSGGVLDDLILAARIRN
jgi:hemerythrin-like domain-containing protein